MVSRRKVAATKKATLIARPSLKVAAKLRSSTPKPAKPAAMKKKKAAPSTPTKKTTKTVSPSETPFGGSPSKTKKSIAKNKKVKFAPETKFPTESVKAVPSEAASGVSAVRVGAEALVAVTAALTAWFYPLFTANVAYGR